MTDDGRAAIGRFNTAAFGALALSVVAHVAQIALEPSPLLLFGCNFLIIFGLGYLAVRAHRESGGEFDSAVAAETIVAFGVLSLLLGLVVAISPILVLDPSKITFDLGTFRSLGEPFLLGLAAAGVAPVVAVLLRNFSAEHGRGGTAADDLDRLAQAAGLLTAELGAARTASADLTQAVRDAAGATARLGPDLRSNLDAVAVAAGAVAPAIGAGATAFAGALDTGGRRFADDLDDAGKRFAAQLDGARGEVDALAAAARTGSVDLAGLAAELGRLRGGAAETADLMDALNGLIASVERFVAARAAAP